MSGLVTRVFLPRPFDATDSGRVTALLNELFEKVEDTRKGRHWEFNVQGHAASLSVLPIADRLAEYEEDILQLECLPEELPEVVVALFGCSSEQDRQARAQLVDFLVREFAGVVVDES